MRFDRHFAKAVSLLALAVAAFVVTPAAAQWSWREDSGRVVYSDRPPPPSIKAAQILRQPAASAAATPATPSAAPAATGAQDAPKTDAAPAAGPKTLAEREMEFRKRQQDRAAAEKKTQEEQQKNSAKAADCERTKGYLRALEEGQRITRTDSAGNREFLDDAQRAAEIERARKSVQSLCN